MARFLLFLRPYRLMIALSIAAVLVFTLTQIAIPLVIRQVIDKVLPAALADEIAEEAAEAQAFEEFTAEQVNQGGGVYGLHIPSGERAKQAFAQWRRIKGR